MKNPCDECMLKTNCTEVCFDKLNYKTLLKVAVFQADSKSGITSYINYSKYSGLLSETQNEERNIKLRRQK